MIQSNILASSRAIKEEAKHYFKSGGRRSDKLALVLCSRYPHVSWKDIDNVIALARSLYDRDGEEPEIGNEENNSGTSC